MPDLATVLFAARDNDTDWIRFLVNGIIFFVVFGIPFLKWIFSLFQKPKDSAQKNDTAAPSKDDSIEASERIRKIREEVARRAAEKNIRKMAPTAPPNVLRAEKNNRKDFPLAANDTAFHYEDELAAARKKLAETQRKIAEIKRGTAPKKMTPTPNFANDTAFVRGVMRDKKALRAAIVAKEILAPPLALR